MTLAFKARSNDESIGSYRYRVLWPIGFLAAQGHAVELYDEANFDRYEAVVFSKAYGAADRKLARRLKASSKRVLLDLCDNHFFNPEGLPKYVEARESLLAMIAICDGVVCSTPVLARAVQAEAGLAETPKIAPDVYEQADVEAGPPTPPDAPARLLWFGRHGSPNAPSGMADLLLVRGQLAQAYARRAFELVICSDSLQRYEALFAGFEVPTRFVQWSPPTFSQELAGADAVLIPLSDNPFVAAKTHNRLSLALSAGVPVVADRLDSYAEFAPFAWIGDWAAGLEAVLERPAEARARAAGARGYLETNWSPRAVAPLWAAALGLPDGAEPRRLQAEPLRPVPHVFDWLALHARTRRDWMIAGPGADLAEVATARNEGALVLALGEAAAALPCDLALVIDAETLAAHGPAIAANAGALLVPADLHADGWASGRSLDSWTADLAALARLRERGRLLRFDLWTGSPDGVPGDFETEAVAQALLAQAGIRAPRILGAGGRPPACPAFEALTSVMDRRRSA